jgi:hypothetical protein
MDAPTYLNVTARLAYYDSMKLNAPARVETTPVAAKLRKLLHRMPRQRRVILLREESPHA